MSEEEIRLASDEYMDIPSVKSAIKCGDVEDLQSHIKVAYANGIRYALENQWHKESENPKDDNFVIAYVRYGNNTYGYEIAYFTAEWNGQNLSHYDKVLFWMPIPYLPKNLK